MQNHLLQVLSLVAMEPPPRLDATHIRNAKVNALLCVPPPAPEDVIVGQYTATQRDGMPIPGYRDDPTVARDSRAATYAAAALRVINARWDGVPFLVRAGKGLGRHLSEIRIQFQPTPGHMFALRENAPNELIIRIQPDETIDFRIWSKVPGLEAQVELRDLDLQYKTAFTQVIPDAYENLLLDVLRGEKSLFIREDELAAAWDIFTPVLHALDQSEHRPEPYEFGTDGPVGADALAARFGVSWTAGGERRMTTGEE
jgi:glucose-6-phosphate 1-dehydrogenase